MAPFPMALATVGLDDDFTSMMNRFVQLLVLSAVILPVTVTPAGAADNEFDVLFLASEGPVLLRIVLDSSGVSIATVRERFVSVLFESADVDQDGRLSSDEAASLKWGDVRVEAGGGRLTKDELAAQVESTFGPRFVVRRKAPLLLQSVQLHSRLDVNGDHHIARGEIEHGVAALSQYDFDDDGTLSPAELQPFPQFMLEAAMDRESEGDNRVFVVLDESEPLEALAERLVATYGNLEPAGLPQKFLSISELAFSSLDADGNTVIDANELIELLNRPRPHAEVHVDYRRRRVTIKIKSSAQDQLIPQESSSKFRLNVRIGGEMVEFSAEDNRYQAGDQISFLRIEFRRQDGDRNGYLGADEFAMLGDVGASFEEVDANDNGQVPLDELDRFIRLDAYHAQSFAEMTVDVIDKPLFQILDENVDRRLNRREFAAGVERMKTYDHDADGTLDAAELLSLRKYRIEFSFGVPPVVRIDRQNRMTADRRMPIVRPATSGPEWFQKMDRNQDGDLTWREFLGPRETFERLDGDGSGWVDVGEAQELSQGE